MARADIVIRSHAKDFRWLRRCLDAVDRHCRGFRDVIVVVPERSAPRLARYGLAPRRLVVCPDVADDYLGQQVTKLHADLLTDAELIVHLDADCIVRAPLRPRDLCDAAGRPRLAWTPHARFAGGRGPWQEPTERFLGWAVERDTMRRQPLAYPRWLYGRLRAHARAVHGVELERYVLARPPLGFSEFNALGAYAHRHHADAFAWELHDDDRFDERWARIFWSWGGVDGADAELRALAGACAAAGAGEAGVAQASAAAAAGRGDA